MATSLRQRCHESGIATIAVFLIWNYAPLRAQTTGATLTGRVVDQSGAAVPGATIAANAPATGFTRSVVTGSDGDYLMPSLPVGLYDVTVQLQGFRTIEQKQVELAVASTRRMDFTLEVAGVQAEVSVTAEAPIVSTDVAVGTVVSRRELENLPLNGRQFANLGVLAPARRSDTTPTRPSPGSSSSRSTAAVAAT
jgi:Carboxypeptidase regulatory-like domain